MKSNRIIPCRLLQEAAMPRFCEGCGEQLRAGDRIAHTLDMARMWHRQCLDAAAPSPDKMSKD